MNGNSLLISKDNNLEVQIRPDGITYTLSDENRHVILRQDINVPVEKDTDIRLFEHFLEKPELQIESENVLIHFETNSYQLVPSDLFRESDADVLFEMVHGKSENAVLNYIILPKWGVHLVFKIEKGIMNFFTEHYPDADIEHHISKILKRNVIKSENAVYANIRKGAVDLIVVQNNGLVLVAPFIVKTNEDICYFILNAYEQLQLDTGSFSLKILSENTVNEYFIDLIEKYIQPVSIIK